MASSPSVTFFLLVISLLVSSSISYREKETHLHFYFHDIVTSSTGSPPTAVRIAQAPATNSSSTFFGALIMMDDPLTEGPDPNSKLIGRAQGMYAFASQGDVGLLMTLNFVFVGGKFNGSTLAILGRNAVLSGVREMPVVGGSGKFRFARGYALAKTHDLGLVSGNATVEYNVFVLH